MIQVVIKALRVKIPTSSCVGTFCGRVARSQCVRNPGSSFPEMVEAQAFANLREDFRGVDRRSYKEPAMAAESGADRQTDIDCCIMC
jgi:hypothetical protein